MKRKITLLFLSLFVFSFISCKDDTAEDLYTTPTGNVQGKVITSNGNKPVGGALIFVLDENHQIHYTYSDANGNFNLSAPSGERTVHIQTGDGSNFRSELIVNIPTNQTLNLDASAAKLNQVANIAYVAGSYDNIQEIVTNLGYNADMITFNSLSDLSIISQYDIIFLNCGSRPSSASGLEAQIDANLAAFVSNGGSLYVSDWDVAYLTGGQNNSSSCGLSGGFIDDNKLCSVNNGASSTIQGAEISSPALAAAMGFNTLNIEYDLGAWQRIINYDATFWDVLVKNPANNEALMIKTQNFSSPGAPQTQIGNAANNGWVTICHVPPGNNQNPITITINENALNAHLAHGDNLGSCNGVSNNGTIYYTTFHNHASGNIGNSALILEYVILNL